MNLEWNEIIFFFLLQNETTKTKQQIERINVALENYMGISDYVLGEAVCFFFFLLFNSTFIVFVLSIYFLARRLWKIAQNKINSMDLAKAIDCTLTDAFDFPKEFIFDVWKIAFEARKNP